ncbi:vacuolar protein sorting-associated protein 37B-like [Coregonus clupeaformis]|uniref:vacuolar protein sorting-associated protein 37B-like n=1 Tax=Coregonus clupeaformis TaxID=59861 RepID=UPI001E1C588F|nr:vacuolar protein sorting-associated protein 37B-like [Coregonus clupeaformis]
MGEMAELTDKFNSFTMTQLNELLEDDEKLNDIVKEMDEMREVQQLKELILGSNISLAEQNLQLQPRLDLQKNQLTSRYRHLQELYDNYQLRKSTLDHGSGNSSLDILLALLQAEGAKIEEETENMADSFLDGELPLDCFIDDYQRRRHLAHLRRVKIDKLRELVLKGLPWPPPIPSRPSRPQDLPSTPYTNGAPSPQSTRAAPSPSPQPQHSGLPYPVAPYPPMPFPSLDATGYPSGPYMHQPYLQAAQQHPISPSPHLPPRTGFIMQ